MKLTWWEWEEMEAAILQRPDLWEPLPDRPSTYLKVVDDQPVYALSCPPVGSTSQFRLVELVTTPMTWPQDEVDSHLVYLRTKFTSYPFREDVERFLLQDLKHTPDLAFKGAVIIARMQQGPIANASTSEVPGTTLERSRMFHIREGGVMWFRTQGEMLRCTMELFRPHVFGGSKHGYGALLLDGFVRLRGTHMANAVEFLTQEIDITVTPNIGLGEGSQPPQNVALPLEATT
jgi:hypothetical protein